jgi:hypothetical protein
MAAASFNPLMAAHQIVATSGRIKVDAEDMPEGSRFLPKPYTARAVVGTLRELIDSKAARNFPDAFKHASASAR